MKWVLLVLFVLSVVLAGCAADLELGEILEASDEPEQVEEVEDEEPEEVVEDSEEVEEETVEEPSSASHVVMITDDGFEPELLNIAMGDRVIWENVRSKSPTKAMIIGIKACNDVKSKIFDTGNSYEYTFNSAVDCTVVDGVYSTMTPMEVIVK